MTGKCYHPDCDKVPDIGSYYCLQHRIEHIKEYRKLLHQIPREDKEKLR